ncbi:hypothetical protein R5R35_011338 [Gryllus longicercus]|uniref:Macro domain-containing protein n=1 Tax=Gryllus longicercus TaxID=2509291 RepID=A0AAN9ZH85_9ORTH
MSSRKSNRKSKKGKVPTGSSDAIDGSISDHEKANSDAPSDTDILRKENELLKKANETSKVECERLKIENLELKDELLKILSENKQLKQEKEKLEKVVEKSGNVYKGMLQSSEMEVENDSFIEDTQVPAQHLLQNAANQKPADADITGDSYLPTLHTKSTMDVEDWSQNEPRKGLDWTSPDCEGKSDTKWSENVTDESWGQTYDIACGGEEPLASQRSYGNQQKQKNRWDKESNTKHDNEGGNVRQYGSQAVYNKERRGNEYKYGNEQTGNRRSHGHEFRHGNDIGGPYGAHGNQRMYNDLGDRQGDQWSGNERHFRNRRNGNQQRYDKNKEHYSKVKIEEINGDLFSAPEDYSLAHCVAADLRMGSGIAVQFKQKFKKVGELAGQRKKVGQVAVLEEEGRFIYYLITKKLSTGKPRLIDLKDSLEDMKNHVEKNQVKKIAIPRLGCGLDRLSWREVRQLLLEIFADVDVTITVYNFTIEMQTSDHPTKKSSKGLYITDHFMRLVNIDRSTLLVVFGSECGYVDATMQELDEKFRFINDYKTKPKKMGDVLEVTKLGEIICILIVKKRKDDLMSYVALEQCLVRLKKIFKNNEYTYMGLQAFMDGDDDLTVAKIVTLLKNIFAYTEGEAWICWPNELESIYAIYNIKERD